MQIAYVLEHITGGWLKYEVDALSGLGAQIVVHPVNPAVYDVFEEEARYRKRTMAGDLVNAGAVSLAHPVKASGLFRKLSSYAGKKIALAALSTARIIGRERPNIIHAHFATAPAAVARAVSILTGIPYGFSAHAYDLFKEPIDREFLAQKCADAAFVRCISEYNRRYLIETTGADETKFHVIHCGVDTRRFVFDRLKPKGHPRKKTIVTVGNLVQQKGIRYLLEALSDPSLDQKGYRTVIIGDGPLKAELMRQAVSLGVNADFLGAVDNRKVVQFYREADLFVLPSVTCSDGHKDGIPVVLMEAMACGVPVISTRLSGIPELVEDGKNGILVPEKDARALSGAIGRLLADADMAKRFSLEGRKKVVDEFEIRDVARQLMALFSGCTAGGGG
ncbi:MAG: glycosyltransferase family 4 protein [Deltaproteobacteria bacterium]|nr:glycosyltransferase family 4 protein [Candidatus Zymogenaceae bacterium]